MSLRLLQLILQHYVQGSGIGHSAMHWCAAKGYIECLQWLVKQGADINNLNAEDSTPLHAAAANGQESIVLYLLDQPNMTRASHAIFIADASACMQDVCASV